MRNDTGVYEGGEISIYYDPMIAKLVTHAGDRAGRDRSAGDCARRLRHRRHPPQHSLPRRADAAPALARRAAVDRLHRRGIPRRLRAACRRAARPNSISPRSRRMSITSTTRASARFPGSCATRRGVAFDLKRAVMLGKARVDVDVEPRDDGVDVVFADGRRLRVDSPWTPGELVWRGDDRRTADRRPGAADPQRLCARPSRRRRSKRASIPSARRSSPR